MKKRLTDLQELTYDYDLEQIAIARALEIALSFSHTRPNGQDCYTLTTGGTRSYGENIAAGSGSTCNTAEKAFTAWREDDEDYDGQGHRRNMLQKRFNAVGIGHVVYNGCHYWVQEFGPNNSGVAATEPFDEYGISLLR